jgi:hypothetical protein
LHHENVDLFVVGCGVVLLKFVRPMQEKKAKDVVVVASRLGGIAAAAAAWPRGVKSSTRKNKNANAGLTPHQSASRWIETKTTPISAAVMERNPKLQDPEVLLDILVRDSSGSGSIR